MKSKKKSHPRSDLKIYVVDCAQDESWTSFFAGQPLILARMVKGLSRSGEKVLTGENIRGYMETNRKQLFPKGTTHKDLWRIFQIYHATLVRHGVIKEVA